MVLRAMARALFLERPLADIERTEDALDVAPAHAAGRELAAERGRVRRLLRPIAAVAAAVVRRTDRPAASMRHRPQARNAAHQHASRAAQLAFDAHAVLWHIRLAPDQMRAQHLDELMLVDRATVQLEIDIDVRLDRRRGGKRVDEL